jgi:hypothetical protein
MGAESTPESLKKSERAVSSATLPKTRNILFFAYPSVLSLPSNYCRPFCLNLL